MRKKEISNLDRLEIGERGKAPATAKAGLKGYSGKSRKESSQRRQQNERANAGKKRQEGTRQQAFKISDHLSEEIIKRLRAIK